MYDVNVMYDNHTTKGTNMNDMWSAPDLNDEGKAVIDRVIKDLDGVWASPRRYNTRAEIDAMTSDDAAIIRIAVRRMLAMHLLHQELHMHEMDDCGDYLTAATDNWATLYSRLWSDDFQNEIEVTQQFLTDFNEFPLMGSDGDVRYDLLSDELIEQLQKEADNDRA
jgi:hypothetical protein